MSQLAMLAGLILCYMLSLIAPIRWAWAWLTNPPKALEILKGYDLLGNTLLNGDAGQYISTRAYIAALRGRRWGIWLSAALDKIEPQHCRKSYESELRRLKALQLEASQ